MGYALFFGVTHAAVFERRASVRIVYLDQNKWIDLARAAKYPAEHPDLHRLLEVVAREVRDGRLA